MDILDILNAIDYGIVVVFTVWSILVYRCKDGVEDE